MVGLGREAYRCRPGATYDSDPEGIVRESGGRCMLCLGIAYFALTFTTEEAAAVKCALPA